MFEERLGGRAWKAEAWVKWQPSDRFSVDLETEYLDRDGWLLHQQDTLMATFAAEQWQPRVAVNYFLTARQQLRLSLQWVGIRAREEDFYRVPDEPGDLVPIDKPEGPGFRPSYDFSVSRFSFQARYRWEFAPLSDVFLVYTRQADQGALLNDESFGDIFQSAWDQPLQDVLVFKVRYRLGS